MEYVLTTSVLSKKYGKFEALKELNMHIPKGAIYGLVGKNGSGKTTLIRLICGLQTPSGGDYTVYGINNQSPDIYKSRKRMGAVIETPSIYLNMTARNNLKQQCLILGMPSYDKIDEILTLVGLTSTGGKKARNFSLGMKQRLGIAIALIGSPDFIVLDEPINGLDPQGIIEIRELVLKLNREYGITFLISSHYLDELSKIATDYGFIEKGQLIKEITASGLRAACKKRLLVTVSDTKALARVLDGKKIDYEVLSDSEANIYSDITLSELAEALSKEDCKLITAAQNDETLETYYMNLSGGEYNA